MTSQQYEVFLSAIRGVSERVDYLTDRFAHQFPTPAEAAAQIDWEVDEILRTASVGVEPFAGLPGALEVGLHLAQRLAERENDAA